MLPHLILIVLQLLGAVYIAPVIKSYIPSLGRVSGYDIDIFIWAILFAVVIFVIGFIGSIVLKGVRTPGAGALTLALVLALVIAALTLVVPITRGAAEAGLRIATLWWPLIGAMIGCFIKGSPFSPIVGCVAAIRQARRAPCDGLFALFCLQPGRLSR
jgi:hypothetical protein